MFEQLLRGIREGRVSSVSIPEQELINVRRNGLVGHWPFTPAAGTRNVLVDDGFSETSRAEIRQNAGLCLNPRSPLDPAFVDARQFSCKKEYTIEAWFRVPLQAGPYEYGDANDGAAPYIVSCSKSHTVGGRLINTNIIWSNTRQRLWVFTDIWARDPADGNIKWIRTPPDNTGAGRMFAVGVQRGAVLQVIVAVGANSMNVYADGRLLGEVQFPQGCIDALRAAENCDYTFGSNIGSASAYWRDGGQGGPGSNGIHMRRFNGEIHTIRIYNRALAPEEVTRLYNTYRDNVWRNDVEFPLYASVEDISRGVLNPMFDALRTRPDWNNPDGVIKSLNLNGIPLSARAEQFVVLLNANKSLESLDIRNTDFPVEFVKGLLDSIVNHPKLSIVAMPEGILSGDEHKMLSDILAKRRALIKKEDGIKAMSLVNAGRTVANLSTGVMIESCVWS